MQAKLKGLREFHKISKEEMARLTGIGTDTYRKKEDGWTQFKLNEMFAIAQRFNMRIEDVFTPTTSRHVKEGDHVHSSVCQTQGSEIDKSAGS